VLALLLIKKRSAPSINKRSVLLVSAVVAVLYVVLMQFSGAMFGFYQNPYFVNANILLERIIPIAAIIIEVEMIRNVLLAQKNNAVSVIAFICCVLSEVLAYSSIAGITNFNQFMDLVGMTLFPAISANVYYHYVAKGYGALPNIVFRLITTLYVYFIPTQTGMTDALKACVKLILPLITLVLISAMFRKEKKNAVRRGGKLSTAATVFAIAALTAIAMLVSCQFRFGALVIATESMTGEINKGDVIIYERYDGQSIKEGQVIVFTENGNRIVHRVVKIQNSGDGTRYYTKGDFNKDMDPGYRTEADIVGLTDIKVAYVGYPTLWLRELVEPAN
jgi:signal peptidase I